MSIVDTIYLDGASTHSSYACGCKISVHADTSVGGRKGDVSITCGSGFTYDGCDLICDAGVTPTHEDSLSFTYECPEGASGTIYFYAKFTHKDIDLTVDITNEDMGTATALPTPRWFDMAGSYLEFYITAQAKEARRINKIEWDEIDHNGTYDYGYDTFKSNVSYFNSRFYISSEYSWKWESPVTQKVSFDYAYAHITARSYDDTYDRSGDGGTVEVEGVDDFNNQKIGESCTFIATPDSGYRFDRWTCEGVESSPTKTSKTFTWTIPDDLESEIIDCGIYQVTNYNVVWTAHFVKTWKVTTSVNIETCATVSLSPQATNEDGSYDDGDVVSATATPTDNCTLLGLIEWNSWSGTANSKQKKGRAYIHQNPWSDITVKEDLNIRAEAEPNDGRILVTSRFIKGYYFPLRGDKPGSTSAGKILCRETPE